MDALFISYAHDDMTPIDWLERLKLYLAPLRRQEKIDFWDDTKIDAGDEWRLEIESALNRAVATIFLVGPSFLASKFINEIELPALLDAAKNRGAKLYPLIIGHCGYQLSCLEKYQSFNDLEKPLEALPTHKRNQILNSLCLKVDQDLRAMNLPKKSTRSTRSRLVQIVQELAKNLKATDLAFAAQSRRRDPLVQAIEGRLAITEHLEYENFFFKYFNELTPEEKFQFDQIRAITEGQLYSGNQKTLRILEENPTLYDKMPELLDLRQHFVFWLNKYEKIFVNRPEMCVLYTGVEDGVPFPEGIDEKVNRWLEQLDQDT